MLGAALALALGITAGCRNEPTVASNQPGTPAVTGEPPATGGPAEPGGTAQPSGSGAASGQSLEVLKVRNALLAAKQLNARDISVTYEEGAVHLRGTVASDQQRAQAEKLARQAAGGTPVRSHLQIGK